MTWRLASISGTLALLLLISNSAGAQPRDSVSVRLQTKPEWQIRVEDRDHRVFEDCGSYCTLDLPEGKYTIELLDPYGRSTGRKSLSIREPQTISVVPRSDGARGAGLLMGLVGSALAAAGLLLTTEALLSSMCEGSCSDSGGKSASAGLVALAAGAVLTPIGWSMFARNRGPHLDIRTDGDASALRRLQFAVVPTKTGAQFGMGLRF